MSFTCQVLPDETTVTEYCCGPVSDAGWAGVTCWLIVTRKVIVPVPNAVIRLTVPLPVDACFCAARCWAAPPVL